VTPRFVGVGGGSGAGKTTLVRRLVARLGAEHTLVIPHDAYYRDHGHLPAPERARVNYDRPDVLETRLLVAHLETLRAGHAVEIPVYDFAARARRPETLRAEPRPLILVDGILTLSEPALRAALDLRVYVQAGEPVRLARRVRRDVRERGRTRESVMEQFTTSVRPMHRRFVEPSRAFADVVVAGDRDEPGSFDALLARIRALVD
jgi:uridine kinase